jgi:predicted CXXCH cytochrome family protein
MRPERRGLRVAALSLAVASAALVSGARADAPRPADMALTKHNLSVSGPGPVRALTENRICVFCHTPHNSAPLSPLWNRDLEPRTYTVYSSPTLRSGPLAQPTGPTKLCLSCHDGTIAMGTVLNPSAGISMSGGGVLPSGSMSDFGLDLSGHHPVSFAYHMALPSDEMAATPPTDLVFGNIDEVHCITCHDPHSDVYGKFLLKDNRYSALCTSCHQITGWAGSAHATSTASVAGILPRAPKTWPAWTQLNEWGCETCHTPHFAPTGEQLLNFTSDPPSPFACTSAGCHSSDPGSGHAVAGGGAGLRQKGADIAGQVRKISAHHESMDMGTRTRGKDKATRALSGEVGCSDCHNPHAATDRRAEAPYVSGMVQGLAGVDRNGAEVRSATYEYEICFKCHGDNSRNVAYVPRVVDTGNMRRAFDTTNASFHPVVGMGRNPDVPSIPSAFEPTMSATTVIYCTACHADDAGGSRGPHGSSFAPILKERYETADDTPESYDAYALCYRCHDRTRILNDTSFGRKALSTSGRRGGHSGHLAAGAPCSACHDAHGVSGAAAPGTGSHTHLINFDVRIVAARPGNPAPVFHDTGTFSGGCTLVCHGVVHENSSYP